MADTGAPVMFDDLKEDTPQAAPQASTQTPLMFDDLTDDSDKYSTLGQKGITALEGVASGIAGPAAPWAEKHLLGVPEENILGREKANPWVHGIAEAGGLGVGLATGTGEAALMTKAGELAAGAAGFGHVVEAGRIAEEAKDAAKLAEKAAKLGWADAPELAGEAAALGKQAEAASGAVSYGAKVGSAVVQQAAEMAVLGSGDETAKLILNDPETSAGSAIANIGLAAALGGAGGAFVTGAVSPLWKATTGAKTNEFLNSIVSRLGGVEGAESDAVNLANKTGVEIPSELAAKIDNRPGAAEAFSKLSQTDTTYAGKKLQETLDNFHKELGDTVLETVGHDVNYAQNVPELNKYDTGHSIAESIVNDIKPEVETANSQWEEKMAEYKKIPVTQNNLNLTVDDLSRMVIDQGLHKAESSAQLDFVNRVMKKLPAQETAEDLKKFLTNLRESNPFGTETYGIAKDVAKVITEAQNRAIEEGILAKGGDAAAELANYKALRGRYADLMNKIDALNEHLHVGRYDGPQSFLNALKELAATNGEGILNRTSGSTKSQVLQLLSDTSPDALAKIRQYHLDSLLRKAKDPSGEFSAGKFMTNFNKLSPQLKDLIVDEAKQNRLQGIDQILDKLHDSTHNWSNTARTREKLLENSFTPLSLLASLMGHSGAAFFAHLGSIGYKEGKDALRLGMLKILGSNQPVKAEAFKSAVSFFHNVYKGEKIINDATQNVFEVGAKVLTAAELPVKADLQKLDKIVTTMQNNPQKLVATQDGDMGHYLPDHQAQVVANSTRAAQYLQTLKPQPHQLSPLGKEVEPSAAQIARYNRALEIAQQPAVVLQHVKDGTLKQSDIQDLGAMYPGLYKNMVAKLSNEMVSRKAEEGPIPYKTRVSLSMFLGQPLDGSITPQGIAAAQFTYMPKQPPQGIKGKSITKLGKSNKEFRTPLQASEEHKTERK